jgi:signal transduction histidine kinase
MYLLDVYSSPVLSDESGGTVILISDITERVNMEEYIIQSEKMATMGGLVAGIAHEINNPLAGILQNIQVLSNRINTEQPKNKEILNKYGLDIEVFNKYLLERKIPDFLENIRISGERASFIVKDMLSFSRKSESKFEEGNIRDILEESVAFLENDFNLKSQYDFRNIQIIREYEQNLPVLYCDRNKLRQVFLNLLKNASHALEDSGKKNPTLILMIKTDKKYINIAIKDNGTGMDKKIQNKIFEPFFTTKKVGSGTGLGLSISYNIITNIHKGIMKVESQMGTGTKFTLKIPINRENKEINDANVDSSVT